MASSIIHGRHLEVTVGGCNVFSESRSHPLFVGLLYGANLRIALPNHDKFEFSLIEGESDLKFVVWKNIENNFPYDDFLGSGRVPLHNVISEGSEESSYPFRKGNNGNSSGELKLVLRCTHSDSHSENLSRDPTLSHLHPSYIHHSLPHLSPSSYYQQPLWPSPPPQFYYWPPSYPPLPPTYPSPSSLYLTAPPHYPPPSYPPLPITYPSLPPLYPVSQTPLLPPRSPSPSSWPLLLSTLLPVATLGSSLTSIAANMFQFDH